MIEKYYEEELRYLYESGREFARAHPDRARFLNIDAVGDRDPYVERLFEGVAFLAARVREKLDDGLPELTESLINLMWPQFLEEIPSAAIVQFRPRPGLLHDTRVLPRGCEVLSGPVGPEAVSCRFITTEDVRLSPFTLRAVERASDTRGNAVLTLRFELDGKASWQDLSLDPIRLHLHAERPTALMLREFLTSRVAKATLTVNGGQLQMDCDPGGVCTPVGFSTRESLLPADQRTFSASALLLEYFTYPDKFLFVDLWGCAAIPYCDPSPATITYTLTLAGDFPPDEHITTENFRLFCSPVINLYRTDIEPVNHTGKREEYRLIADAAHPASATVHSVVRVAGIDRATGERHDYEPLNTFRNIRGTHTHTFSTRRGRSADGTRQVFLRIGGEALAGLDLREESLNVEAWCTNGVLPREEIGEGGINRGGRDFPDYVMVTNITRPTLPCFPPDKEDYHWVFLSHQSSNYVSLGSADALQAFLKVYDWSSEEGNVKRIQSISDVEIRPVEKIVSGSLIRGVMFEVSVLSSHFGNSGDIRLFGEVLSAFLGQYVSINSYLECVLVLKPSGRRETFSSARGQQWLI
jgi:type VI secretion system protein ImpG